jgi:mannose-6-phosphate isomerase-like protein (cupin superfamily)
VQHASMEKATYRHQDWGPAYLVQGASSDIGLLRLRPGDEMTNHIHHHCDESFIVIGGSASLWVSCSEKHTLTVGDVYRCAPAEMHYFVNNTDAPFVCVFIKSPASPGDTVSLPWTPGELAPTVPPVPAS